MSTRIKLTRVNETKCNFCHQWIITPNLNRSVLNSCSQCITKHRSGVTVCDQKGENYKMVFVQGDQFPSRCSLRSIQTQEGENQYSRYIPRRSWSQVEALMHNNSLNQQEKQLIESRMADFNRQYEQEVENIIDLIKEFSRIKSQTSLNQSFSIDNLVQYESRIFQENPGEKYNSNLASVKAEVCKLEDICEKLDETRFVEGYQYYYDMEDIDRYKKDHIHQKDSRCFGTQIKNYNQEDLFLQFKPRYSLKTNSSNSFIQPPSQLNLRLSEEALKFKITSYLLQRYQSNSLNKIIAMNIKQAYQSTKIQPKMIQLVSFKITVFDLNCYLKLFEDDNLHTIKLINVGLQDHHLSVLIDYIRNKNVETLVLSGNRLTDSSIVSLLSKSLPFLRQLYLGKNRINKYRMKQNIAQLRSKFVLYL